jgi:hypothetical protein
MGKSQYTEEMGKQICDAVSSSTLGLEDLRAQNPHFPAQSTVYKWLNDHPTFSEMYANAKRAQAAVFVEEIIKIADNEKQDQFIGDEGKTVLNSVKVARDRLRIDTRKWIACKLLPKIYGDKQQHTTDDETGSLIRKVIDKL